jgi:hypothetical protein
MAKRLNRDRSAQHAATHEATTRRLAVAHQRALERARVKVNPMLLAKDGSYFVPDYVQRGYYLDMVRRNTARRVHLDGVAQKKAHKVL